MHLSCYIVIEKNTLKDIISLFIEDIKNQFKHRLEILEEEA